MFFAARSLARSLGHPISVDVQKVEREWNFLMKEAMTALTKQPARTTGARSRSPRFASFHALRTHEQGGWAGPACGSGKGSLRLFGLSFHF